MPFILHSQLTVLPMALVQPLHRNYLSTKLSGVGRISPLKSSRNGFRSNNISRRFEPRCMTSFVCLFQKAVATRSKPSEIHQASSSVNAETSKLDESDKSEAYSSDMSNAMGAVLTYRHELGINYSYVLPDLIVGSCLQSPEDVDKLREIGVGTIFCLQKDSDLDYFGVDITAIQEHTKECDGMQHIRAEIRDFDPFDLRMKLPPVIAKLQTAIRNGRGITYVHCTAGLGRAPAVALSYMYWILGYKLSEANKLLQNVRKCCPNIEAIKRATADILSNQEEMNDTMVSKALIDSVVSEALIDSVVSEALIDIVVSDALNDLVVIEALSDMVVFEALNDPMVIDALIDTVVIAEALLQLFIGSNSVIIGANKQEVTLKWRKRPCSIVEVSGLDVGWDQRLPLVFDETEGYWVLHRDLPFGHYEYKYVIDGNWVYNPDELVTQPNVDGYVNNYIEVKDDHLDDVSKETIRRLMNVDADLTETERRIIHEKLEALSKLD